MNAKYLFILAHLYFNCAFSQDIILKPYYHNQLGFEIGLGGAGEKNVPFLFGLQAGTFYRISNHQFGLKAAQFSRGLFYSRDECTTINLYYGSLLLPRMLAFLLNSGEVT